MDDAQLQKPHLYYASAIRAAPALASTLTTFVNEGYRYLSPASAQNWATVYDGDRLVNPDSIHQVLGDDGRLAVVYHPDDGVTPVACAAAQRWRHDLEGYVAAGEDGWEILMVTTHVDFMRRGLAGRCVDALIGDLVRQTRDDGKRNGQGKLQVWVHAVEDLNGAYWRKKGWVEVRSYTRPAGHWGSKNGYCLLVLLQEFNVD
jgi:GNAT superfamily N-acetyltransferase